MTWKLLSDAAIHKLGLDSILPYLEQEGVTVIEVNARLGQDPQVVAERWGLPAFIFARTATYPSRGTLSQEDFLRCLALADKHKACAFFASVGLACVNYPDGSEVKNDADLSSAIENAGFAVAYEGLVVMATSDRVRVL